MHRESMSTGAGVPKVETAPPADTEDLARSPPPASAQDVVQMVSPSKDATQDASSEAALLSYSDIDDIVPGAPCRMCHTEKTDKLKVLYKWSFLWEHIRKLGTAADQSLSRIVQKVVESCRQNC